MESDSSQFWNLLFLAGNINEKIQKQRSKVDHRTTECLVLEGAVSIKSFTPCSHGQEHLPLDQMSHSPI